MIAKAEFNNLALGANVGGRLASFGANVGVISLHVSAEGRYCNWRSAGSPLNTSGTVAGCSQMTSQEFVIDRPHAQWFLGTDRRIHMKVEIQSGLVISAPRLTKVSYNIDGTNYDLLGGWQPMQWSGLALSGIAIEDSLTIRVFYGSDPWEKEQKQA